jgi:nucleolar protein 56
LRAQVEERLNFFETGAPPSKNADAICKVLDASALEEDDDDDDGMDVDAAPLTSLEAEPKKEKKKKRKSESMEVDEDEEDSHSSKGVKLSKEEEKALKKAMKEKAKAEGGEVGSHLSLQSLVLNIMSNSLLPRRSSDRHHRLQPRYNRQAQR